MQSLQIPRIFTAASENPYDSVKWITTTAEIKNGQTGNVIFRQEGVEFPASWSQLAINVVTSKYFYGDVSSGNGSPADGQREYSLRQLIDRVVDTITASAVAQNVLDEDNAAIFEDELRWLLLHQYGSFNSPVWFNVGLAQAYGLREEDKGNYTFGIDPLKGHVVRVDPYKRPQASACFITAVDDSVESIWECMAESARLFKYGSGIGADWSKLRSQKDKLSGGGIPSGPVSFMKVQDATGGTIKSGGKTRRAAIMQTLKSWHPDIMEFISAKQEEERKAHALIEQGYDGSFNGPAYGSVAFQNVNQSVRVDDDFMESALSDQEYDDALYDLRSPATGKTLETVYARDVLTKIAEGTHFCGDPGLQYEDTIQRWHTCPNTAPINSSNPCSEYMFLDNSACNLASLNLRKYQHPDGTVDTRRLQAAARIFATAQEVLVSAASYPAEAIARNSEDYRPLGLGFANLGALLMSMGLPYDSDEGRAVAAGVMANIHFAGYERSAEIAALPQIGPFAGFEANREPMLAVMRKHQAAIDTLYGDAVTDLADELADSLGITDLLAAACGVAERCVNKGEAYGYRNAQMTVLAPTGTIGFMMDCDTTGIEPDIALVKYKLLAGKGDGTMKIVNQTVREALDRLGYYYLVEDDAGAATNTPDPKTATDDIIAYINENDTIEGAPHLKDEHLPVFDCAFKPFGGERSIHYAGHIKMMAACQPFISGAISKTVNMPEHATVEDIAGAYLQGWELGLKAVAIYRENSKRSQPLSTSEGGNTKNKEVELSGDGMPAYDDVELNVSRDAIEQALTVMKRHVDDGTEFDGRQIAQTLGISGARRRLPDDRESVTHKFSIGGHEGYLHVGLYPETDMPGELFITMSKQGSTISGFVDAFAIACSIALQYGAPIESLCDKFAHMRFEPAGFTKNEDIRMATSVPDYVARYLKARFVDRVPETEATAAAKSAVALTNQITVAADAGGSVTFQNQGDAPACAECGSITVRSGSCFSCPACGSSTGCG